MDGNLTPEETQMVLDALVILREGMGRLPANLDTRETAELSNALAELACLVPEETAEQDAERKNTIREGGFWS